MKTNLLALAQAGIGRLRTLWLRPLTCPERDEVLQAADVLAHRPMLRRWLFTAAALPRKTRRALLDRAQTALDRAPEEARWVARLADENLQDAVLDELFRRQRIALLPPDQRSGRLARARLNQLTEALELEELAAA